ncbi:vacuolar protein sorting-associated protein 13 family protein [Tieghemostelium lacteum]|uniref:Vacuolar protein sorting-associated protein 13 family protein n=1 Tax=Tieghemostelium lacteum TaxID=361077 RepID=A0A151Z548_TIELA|nr:vacuolar protein sorting-associated protein 13 family protein [Tieghemostelium lacteum]|eukprot:KYQ89086.1 vacuolar protein sorting-associated protein 13 family protein [Tieghemostelium lacteum]
MFERLVADLLTRYLGEYIKTLNTENLKIGIWSGNVSLENLELKKRALEKFNLPFTIKEGFLGKLSLKIPWNNLKTEPVIVIVENLYIVASPKSENIWDEEDEEIQYKKKLKKLKVYEAMKEERKKQQRSSTGNLKPISTTGTPNITSTPVSPTSPPLDGSSIGHSPQNEEIEQGSKNSDTLSSSSKSGQLNTEDMPDLETEENYTNQEDQSDQEDDYDEDEDESLVNNSGDISNNNNNNNNSSSNNNNSGEDEQFKYENMASTSFTDSLRNKIVDNLQIKIYNVHIRFEDNTTIPDKPFSFGMTLESVLAESTNELWEPSYIHANHLLVHKLVRLQNLSVYWDTAESDPILKYNSISEFKSKMSNLIYGDSSQHSYLLHPVCGSLKLLINKSIVPNKLIPAYTFNFEFQEINWELEMKQYHGIIALADRISLLKKGERYRRLKPKDGLKDIKAKWRFAIDCVIYDINEKRSKWVPSYFLNRRRDRLDYIHLYKLTKRKKPLNEQQKSRYSNIEKSYSFEDLIYFRSLADAQLKGEDRLHITPSALSPKNSGTGGGGWFSWLSWGGGGPQHSKEDKQKEEQEQQQDLLKILDLSDEQTRELYKTIEYDEHQTTSNIIYPKDYVKTRMNFQMQRGSVSFRLKENNKQNADLVIELVQMSIKLDKFIKSMYIQSILQSISVRDYFTEGTVYPYLMKPVGVEQQQEVGDDVQPLFEMILQQNPLDSDASYSVFIDALPLEIVYNKGLMDSMLHFFGNAPSDTLKEIEEAARNQIKIFKDKTTLRIQYELQNHKTVDLDINIKAPQILIPESLSKPAPILVLDLGSFSLLSVPNDEDDDDLQNQELDLKSNIFFNQQQQQTKEQTQPSSPSLSGIRSSSGITDGDNNMMANKYFYDSFELQLKNIQLFIITNDNSDSLPLITKFDINFKIYKCIIKSQTLLSKLKLFGDLPSLNILLSQSSIEILIRIVNTLTDHDLPEFQIKDITNRNSSSIPHIASPSPPPVKKDEQQSPILEEIYSYDSIDSLEMDNSNDQLPILMIYNTILEVNFSIPSVSLVITERDQPFIRLFISDIGAQCYKRTFDTSINLSLKKLLIEDLYQDFTEESFRYLANSRNSNSSVNDKSGLPDDLINVSISSIQKNSPLYSGISQQIDISFNSLLVNINKKIILKLIKLINSIESTILSTLKSNNSKSTNNNHNNNNNNNSSNSSFKPGSNENSSFKIDKNNPKILMDIKMKSLEIILNDDNESYFAFSIQNLQLGLDLDMESSSMKFKLGNLLITDISKESSKDLGPLFGTDGEHIVEIFVLSYKEGQREKHHFDTKIGVRMSSVKLIVIRSLIDRLTDYFDDFGTSTGVDQILSESAKGAVEMIGTHHQQNRVIFEVNVISPRIIFPKSQISSYVIIADLGQISCFNSLKTDTEEIYIYASSINFHSCKFQNGKIQDETIEQLSNKVNLYINIEVKQSPKQKVIGEISPIQIKITEQQYSLLISIIKNLVEPNLKKKKRKIISSQRSERQSKLDLLKYVQLQAYQQRKEILDQVSFRIPHITVEIFRKNKESVVAFDLDEFEFSIIEYLNGQIFTTINLNSLDLTDTRASTNNQFKKLIYHQQSKEKELSLVILEQRNGDTEMKVVIDNFCGIVVPESLVAMIDFIMPGVKALSSLSDVSPTNSPPIPPHVHHQGMQPNQLLQSPVKTMLQQSSQQKLNSKSKKANSSLTVHIETKNIQITFIDNPTRLDSKALVLKGCALGKVNIQNDTLIYKDLKFSLENIEVFKCRMDKRDSTVVSIIDPLSLTLSIYNVEGKEDNLPIDIIVPVEPVHITFSYQDFLLCKSVFLNIESLSKSLSTLFANANKANVKPMNADDSESVSTLSSIPTINFQSPLISLTIINDEQNGKYSGVAQIKLSDISMEVTKNQILVGMYMVANYFNNSKSVWEPVIESWGFKLGIETSNSHDDHDFKNIVISTSEKLKLNITKSLFDLVNQTHQTLLSLQKIAENPISPRGSAYSNNNNNNNNNNNTGEDYRTSNPIQIQLYKTSNFHPFILRNETGIELQYLITEICPPGAKPLHQEKLKNFDRDKDIYLDFKEITSEFHQKNRDTTSFTNFRIHFYFTLFETIYNLPIDKCGIYICTLKVKKNFTGSEAQDRKILSNLQLVFEIKVDGSSKLLILRNNILLKNETDHPVEFITEKNAREVGSKDQLPSNSIYVVLPGQSKPFPLLLETYSMLSFRPKNPDEELNKQQRWSQPISCKDFSIPKSLVECPPGRFYSVYIDSNVNDNQHQLYYNSPVNPLNSNIDDTLPGSVEDDDTYESISKMKPSDHIIRIMPPLVIENLLSRDIKIELLDQEHHSIIFQKSICHGKKLQCYTLNISRIIMMKLNIFNMNGTMNKKYWTKPFQINRSTEKDINQQSITTTLIDQYDNPFEFYVNINYSYQNGSIKIVIYSSYWILNFTGLNIKYKLSNNPNSSSANNNNNQLESDSPLTTTTTTSSNNTSAIMIQNNKDEEAVNYYKDPRNWYSQNLNFNHQNNQKIEVEPIMFSPQPSFKDHSPYVVFQVDKSKWSPPIPLQINKLENINIQKLGYGQTLSLQYTLSTTLSKDYYKTKMVTISPKYILINNLPFPVYYSQTGSTCFRDYSIRPQEALPFHFLDDKCPSRISLRLSPTDEWSGSFEISKSSSFHLKLNRLTTGKNNASKDHLYIPLVQIIFENNINYIVINPESIYPPYRIENCTNSIMEIYQLDTDETKIHVEPNESIRYIWKEPMGTKRLDIKLLGTSYKKNASLDKVQAHKPVNIKYKSTGKDSTIKLEILANGPTNILRLTDSNQQHLKSNQSLPRSLSINQIMTGNRSSIMIDAYLGGITISLIDSQPTELLYIGLDGIEFHFKEQANTMEQTIDFSIQNFKVDNQLYFTPYPVMIVTSNETKDQQQTQVNNNNDNNDVQQQQKEPVGLLLSLTRSTKYKIGIRDYIKELKFKVQPVQVQIDETLVYYLYKFVNEISSEPNSIFKTLLNEPKILGNSDYYSLPLKPENMDSKRLYFEHLTLPIIDIVLSYRTSHFASAVIGMVGSVLANIDRAPLHLESWKLDHQFTTPDQLTTSLLSHYKWEFSKILLYSDIFGAPISLAENITKGINDFISESTKSGLSNPDDFTKGVAKGAKSLVKNSIYGIFNSASKLSGSIGRAVALLSMDESYLQQREDFARSLPPKHMIDGVSTGLQGINLSIATAIKGLYNQPIQEYNNQGVAGIVVGLGKGLIDSVVKPAVGAIDMFSYTTQGIKNSYLSDPSVMPQQFKIFRTRPPRYIGSDHIIKPYSLEDSKWQEIIKIIGNRYHPYLSSNEFYLTNFRVYTKKQELFYIVISNNFFYVFNDQLNQLFPCIKLWNIRLSVELTNLDNNEKEDIHRLENVLAIRNIKNSDFIEYIQVFDQNAQNRAEQLLQVLLDLTREIEIENNFNK